MVLIDDPYSPRRRPTYRSKQDVFPIVCRDTHTFARSVHEHEIHSQLLPYFTNQAGREVSGCSNAKTQTADIVLLQVHIFQQQHEMRRSTVEDRNTMERD